MRRWLPWWMPPWQAWFGTRRGWQVLLALLPLIPAVYLGSSTSLVWLQWVEALAAAGSSCCLILYFTRNNPDMPAKAASHPYNWVVRLLLCSLLPAFAVGRAATEMQGWVLYPADLLIAAFILSGVLIVLRRKEPRRPRTSRR